MSLPSPHWSGFRMAFASLSGAVTPLMAAARAPTRLAFQPYPQWSKNSQGKRFLAGEGFTEWGRQESDSYTCCRYSFHKNKARHFDFAIKNPQPGDEGQPQPSAKSRWKHVSPATHTNMTWWEWRVTSGATLQNAQSQFKQWDKHQTNPSWETGHLHSNHLNSQSHQIQAEPEAPS